jgi:glycosyltransferase involved in cell wall biosynthesis
MKVSIITPTFGRHDLLSALHRTFDSQSYEDKELLVLDDSPSPSDLFERLGDPRVRYMHSSERMTVGAKRDRLVREATGDVIVQFDDDDYYTPRYVETMLRYLAPYDLVKLSGWFVFDCGSGETFYWNAPELAPVHFVLGRDVPRPTPLEIRPEPDNRQQWIETKVWGYGFSYVFRKVMYAKAQFDVASNHGEDYSLVERSRARGFRVGAVPDQTGLCVQVVHTNHLSRAFPNYRVPAFLMDSLFGSDVRPHLVSLHINDAPRGHAQNDGGVSAGAGEAPRNHQGVATVAARDLASHSIVEASAWRFWRRRASTARAG